LLTNKIIFSVAKITLFVARDFTSSNGWCCEVISGVSSLCGKAPRPFDVLFSASYLACGRCQEGGDGDEGLADLGPTEVHDVGDEQPRATKHLAQVLVDPLVVGLERCQLGFAHVGDDCIPD
jgi:hypothetical protein